MHDGPEASEQRRMTGLDGLVSALVLALIALLAPLGHPQPLPAAPALVAAELSVAPVDEEATPSFAEQPGPELEAAVAEPVLAPPMIDPLASAPELATDRPLVILLMGVDERPDQVADGVPGRTDTMLLLSVDAKARVVSMASIPRDSYVDVPRHGWNRVNSAYEFGEIDRKGGGPALARETVSRLFGVRVDRYALVSVPELREIVDDLGGVWVNVPNRLLDAEYPTDNYGFRTIDIPRGRQLLNGDLAVAYARMRHPDSDFGRQVRQQEILQAIWQRALDVQALPRLPLLIPHLFSIVHTDLQPMELLSLARFAQQLDVKRGLVTVTPDPKLTPPFIGPGGAAYVQITSAFRSAVALAINHPGRAAQNGQAAPA